VKAWRTAGEPPTPSPGTDQPPRPTANPLPAHASHHKRPPAPTTTGGASPGDRRDAHPDHRQTISNRYILPSS
jgi:hypothetical protein